MLCGWCVYIFEHPLLRGFSNTIYTNNGGVVPALFKPFFICITFISHQHFLVPKLVHFNVLFMDEITQWLLSICHIVCAWSSYVHPQHLRAGHEKENSLNLKMKSMPCNFYISINLLPSKYHNLVLPQWVSYRKIRRLVPNLINVYVRVTYPAYNSRLWDILQNVILVLGWTDFKCSVQCCKHN